jgi:hypothetical protein
MATPITAKGKPGYRREAELIKNEGLTPQQAYRQRLSEEQQPKSAEQVGTLLINGFIQDILDSEPTLRSALQDIYRRTFSQKEDRIDLTTEIGMGIAEGILRSTDWVRGYSDRARKFLLLEKSDPSSAASDMQAKADELRKVLADVGGNASDEEINNMARLSLIGGTREGGQFKPLTEKEIRRFVTKSINFGTDLRGQAAQVQNKLFQAASEYGFTDIMGSGQLSNWSKENTRAVLDGDISLDDVTNQLRDFAIGRFPAFANQLRAGLSLNTLVSPYRGAVADILELDENLIGYNDPLMEKALGAMGQDGQQSLMPLWQLKMEARKDPRFLNTDKANELYNSIGVQIAQDFGFI